MGERWSLGERGGVEERGNVWGSAVKGGCTREGWAEEEGRAGAEEIGNVWGEAKRNMKWVKW